MTNLGQHSLDIVHWFLGVDGPDGRHQRRRAGSPSQDNGETPDTQDALFEYPGWTASWSHREAQPGRAAAAAGWSSAGRGGA